MLFRGEVLEARRSSWLGEISLTRPVPLRVFTMGAVALLVFCVSILIAACASFGKGKDKKVLIIGNSIVYTNNLPAVFQHIAHARSSGHGYVVDMFARGGATLTQSSEDHRLQELISTREYDAIVLQERGGDVLCVLSVAHGKKDECRALVEAHRRLAGVSKEHGAEVIYLGTYQYVPAVSAALVRAERRLAEEIGATYVEVSETLNRLRLLHPDMPWLHSDNAHPGFATTFLMAAGIYKALSGDVHPHLNDICITAMPYSRQPKKAPFLENAELLSPTGALQCLLDKNQVQAIRNGLTTEGTGLGT